MEDKIKICIFGDICPTDDYRVYFDSGAKNLLNNTYTLVQESDLSICNLECPATDGKIQIAKTGPNLKAEKRDIKVLSEAGFDVLSLANNHILDYGEFGVLDTLSEAQKYGLDTFGAGENISEAQKPLIREIKGKRIGFLSFAEHEFNIASEHEAGANLFDPYISLPQIAKVKEKVDFLIALYHGGIEHYIYPSELLQKKCRAIVSAGADVVLCQHSHCIGTYEYFNGKYILYGQGNGIYGYRKNDEKWNEGLVIEIVIGDEFKINLHLLEATVDGIRLANHENKKKRLQRIDYASKELSNSYFLKKEWMKFCKCSESLNMPLLYGKNKIFVKINRMFNNILIKYLIPKSRKQVTLDLIRCDSWKEVLQTTLEKDIYGK